jgi:large subunit ribosomal protein L35
MPKVKTHKASQRRVRITKNGKILRRKSGVRHLLTNRSPKTKRKNRCPTTTEAAGYVRKFKRGHCGV